MLWGRTVESYKCGVESCIEVRRLCEQFVPGCRQTAQLLRRLTHSLRLLLQIHSAKATKQITQHTPLTTPFSTFIQSPIYAIAAAHLPPSAHMRGINVGLVSYPGLLSTPTVPAAHCTCTARIKAAELTPVSHPTLFIAAAPPICTGPIKEIRITPNTYLLGQGRGLNAVSINRGAVLQQKGRDLLSLRYTHSTGK